MHHVMIMDKCLSPYCPCFLIYLKCYKKELLRMTGYSKMYKRAYLQNAQDTGILKALRTQGCKNFARSLHDLHKIEQQGHSL